MRNRFYVSLFFISLNFAQEPTFTYPTGNVEFEVGQTYEIKWSIFEPRFQNKDVLLIIWDHPSTLSAFADKYYITSDGSVVKGNCCQDSSMKESYSVGQFASSGSFNWTVPHELINKFETERPLLCIAFMDYSQSLGSQREGYIYPSGVQTIGFVDTTAPTVTSVSSTATDSTYGIGSVIPITVTFDESVTVTGTPQLTLETGDTDAVVDYSSGSDSSILTFNYTVASGHISNDLEVPNENALVLNGGTIKDAVGYDATLTFPVTDCCIGINKNIVIDGIVPVIVSTTNFNNVYAQMKFSEGIYNTNGGAGGVEKEDFNINLTQNGGTTTEAIISSILSTSGQAPSGADTVINFNLGLTGTPSGVESIMITPKLASVYDIAGNDASTIAQANNSVVLTDQLPPSISSVSLASDNSTIAVAFSEAVYDTNSGSGALEENDFYFVLRNSVSGTSGVLSSDTPSSISADGNKYTLGISFTTPSKGGDTLYVGYYDDSIYDAVGNEIARDIVGTQVGVSYYAILNDVVPPVISSTAPNQNSYVNHTKVSYTLNETAASGTITWTRTGGSEDSSSPHEQALAGDELNAGAHTDITLTNSPTLVDGAIYTISFDVIDVAGNAAITVSASNVTYDFTAPTVKQVSPIADSFLPIADNSKIRIDFSEPITAYNVDASSELGTNLNTSIQQASDSLVISVDAPLTSLDSLTFTITQITDRAGSVGDKIQVSYQTSILADYNNDYKVDVQDLADFVSLWPNLDLGPANGTIPYLTPDMDGLANLRDVGIFTRMWHWSYANNGASSKVFGSIGDPIKIDQSSDGIIIPMPDNAVAGEVLFQYQKTDVDLGLSDEITENRMVISYWDSLQGLLAVNFGYMKEMQNKNLSFSLGVKGRNNSDLTISYVYYDENSTVVNMGTQDFNLKAIPLEFALHQNYPNPFNPITTINYDLPQQSHVNIMIYDILGREVAKLVNSEVPAGYQSVIWNTRNNFGTPVSAGIYFYQIQTKDFVKTKKMVLLK